MCQNVFFFKEWEVDDNSNTILRNRFYEIVSGMCPAFESSFQGGGAVLPTDN